MWIYGRPPAWTCISRCTGTASAGLPAEPRPFPLRTAARLARPVRNWWRSRHDLAHFVGRPTPAHAIFLGDGVSLDLVDGAWQDRFGEPVISALENRGLRTFLMQGGALNRLPWRRPTFAANVIAVQGSRNARYAAAPCELPALDSVIEYLAGHGVRAGCLEASKLAGRAALISSTASAFERVLRVVRPTLAFVVTYYADLGPAFMLACRRQNVLSVDLQHCPQEGAHKAYGWSAVPQGGYATLPAVFWNWTEREAADIGGWASGIALPWHRSIYGGHTQLASYMDQEDPCMKEWNAKFHAMVGEKSFEREILVALQPIGGHLARWEALAAQIDAAPAHWRWWIRRHPASSPSQDAEFGRLLSMAGPNVLTGPASQLPLPVLLRHMSVVLSLASGTAAEAAALGIPALFLSEDARAAFAGLIERGCAAVVDIASLNAEIARTHAVPGPCGRIDYPPIDETLSRLEDMARDYPPFCRANARRSPEWGSGG